MRLAAPEQAELLLEQGMRHGHVLSEVLHEPSTTLEQRREFAGLAFEVYCARLKCAWALKQQVRVQRGLPVGWEGWVRPD